MKARRGGFTLIEVLVALAVVAVALAAVVGAVTAHARNAATLEARTVAHWVAMNTYAEWRLRDDLPDPGDASGSTTMAGADWRWTVTVEETPDDAMRRLDITVREADRDTTRATLGAYLGASTREAPQ